MRVNLPRLVPCPVGGDGRAGTSGSSEQVGSPLEFGRGGEIKALVKKPPPDLVADLGFPESRAGDAERPFLYLGSVPPAIKPLVGVSENDQGTERVGGGGQHLLGFADCFFTTSQEGQNPHAFRSVQSSSRASMLP